tara:strand:- start:3159 stop:3377 length:219 start_codon:yes stop_codon:yes gene_type:complete
MKKGLLLIAVAGMMFTSCKKCKECTSVATLDGTVMSTTSVEVCGTSSDFDEAEGTVTSTSDGFTSAITTTCK